jgi:hypothetical protein
MGNASQVLRSSRPISISRLIQQAAAAATLAGAWFALARHFAQTEADRQRRITESFQQGH